MDELYEHAPCGYLTTRADGVIARVNTTLLTLLAETRERVLGLPFQALLPPDAGAFYETHCAPLLASNGVLVGISIDLARADGTRLPAIVNWRRVADAAGRLLGYRVMVTDASERAGFERELSQERERTRQQEAIVRQRDADLEHRVEARTTERVQSQKMESLGRLTGGVAHDFNNLLTPILITLEVLHKRYITDERALRMAASAISAAERARLLISRLLAFAGRQHLRAQAVDLASMVEGMLGLVTQALGPAIEAIINIAPNLPPAKVDRNQLELALLNLCVNARDAMPDGGTLAIRGEATTIASGDGLPIGEYLCLSVSDTGAGMNPEMLNRAAEPFYSTKDIGKGSGLGLSMVHGLAAQSGGMLTLQSAQGFGTTATIWLPVDDNAVPAAKSPLPLPAEASQKPLSILLVDDDELVRSAIAEMLADLGHSTVQAASGDQAVEILHKNDTLDMLVTDYLMPNMTGVELARVARVAQPNLPILLVTGYANIKDVDGGGLPRLAKPFTTNDLSAKIKEILDGSGVAQAPRIHA